ncbi:P-type conjugative transfer protein TrbL [Salmonella enterica subsp. enterica serovar Newport]|nr:P-type conjugative transfer protein TrbL [Salmonella enterica]EDH0053108.1 P-type conjugative transfer protein TrbL [Salmonella enterica subsp. enterica serovar Newport]EBI4450465.1 P-type conjugative transfer protein TrbL [Salmonella enterica]EFR4657789.1 P-type conjugative transfer protein TrbL [Salmonella enterica]EIO8188553.1 P-type conjugative transfer protein TrbL [Salmonella enterica]
MKNIIIAFAFMLMIPIAHADVASWSLGESKTAEQVQHEMEEAKKQAELILKYTTECANGNNQSCSELEYIKSQGSELGLDANFVEQFQQTFTSEIDAWLPPLQKAAKYLLFTLGIIALVLKMVPLVLKGADLGDIIKELIIFILVIGLWYAIIINAKEWTDAIIDSFMKLANLANKNSMEATPVGILKQGFVVVSKIFTGSYNPITLLTQVICALVIMVIYAKIAFYVLKVMLETFIVSYGGIVLLGFGALSFTSDYAKRYVTYVLSCGIKLFMALLIVGFGGNFIASFLSLNFTLFGNCVAIVAIALMLMFIAEQIPEAAQSMITGASLGGGNMNIGGTLATMAAAATAFTAACYAGAAAFKAAGAANAAGGGGAATGGLQGTDLANALSKGGGSGMGGGGSGGSSSLPNGGKSGAQLVKEGKVQSPDKNTGNNPAGTGSGKPQQSRTGAALKAVAQSVGEGMLNKAAGGRGSTAANITRAALNNAAQSHQSTESPRKPTPSPYAAKSDKNNKDG